ncbi:hypothetical protein RRG08_062525 [Elysia crispata]|uniref:Uncharacterized protein n=1 Tax=Elysia crispata TaxID=231223 RepID=A0AAE0YQW1_9GAST|nr:hypothetical protein RRG08_062525 [Elysia crispata]
MRQEAGALILLYYSCGRKLADTCANLMRQELVDTAYSTLALAGKPVIDTCTGLMRQETGNSLMQLENGYLYYYHAAGNWLIRTVSHAAGRAVDTKLSCGRKLVDTCTLMRQETG